MQLVMLNGSYGRDTEITTHDVGPVTASYVPSSHMVDSISPGHTGLRWSAPLGATSRPLLFSNDIDGEPTTGGV